jgi:SAM-dependent methyltransferase
MSTAKTGMRGDAPKVTITPPKDKPDDIVIAPKTGKMFEPKAPEKAELKNDEEDPVTAAFVNALLRNAPTEEEMKYVKSWKLDAYRNYSPGEKLVPMFLELFQGGVEKGTTIIDWGCGTGRASKLLYEAGFDVTMVDFAENCLDEEIKELAKDNPRLRFFKQDLTKKCDLESEYGFCTDVMEHIPTEDVDTVLNNILNSSKFVYFQIATVPDGFGAHPDINEPLHLTVENYFEWLKRFHDLASVIIRSEKKSKQVIFYVTGWSSLAFDFADVKVNIPKEQSHEHMRENAKLGLKNVMPYQPQDTEVMMVCGGPSTLEFKDEIIEKREAGMPLITMNGTYKLMLDWGLKPSMFTMIDGREFNERFIYDVPGMTDDCQYFISSHCHPKVFEKVPHERTYMWSVSLSKEDIEIAKEEYGEMYKDWVPCPGGSTVALRTLCLLRMLGFSKIHVYGMDSCNFGEHHAYDQPENDGKQEFEILICPGSEHEKAFNCHGWQVYQAREFMQMIPRALADCDLIVYGDGMISYILNTMAELDENEEVTIFAPKEKERIV